LEFNPELAYLQSILLNLFLSKNLLMIITTTETVPGHEVVEILDIARGSTIRARHVGRDIMAGFKNLVGGEIKEYTKLLAQAREEAISRMIYDAEQLGADAVVNVRFNTSAVMQASSEILAYGTAVKLEKLEK
jgi:uncharacterized protein YbjQ (UPF0145 family)